MGIAWQVGTSWNRLTVQALPLFFVIVIPEVWHQLFLDRINGNGRIVENNLEYSPLRETDSIKVN